MRSAIVVVAALAVFSSVGCHHNLTGKKASHGGGGALAGFLGDSSGDCASCGGGGGGGHSGLGGRGGGGLLGRHGGHGGGGCDTCGDGGCASCGGARAMARPAAVGHLPHGYLHAQGPAGPPTASFGYPYYTTRAPRDFLMANPPSIGP